jgi:hypothetical protein
MQREVDRFESQEDNDIELRKLQSKELEQQKMEALALLPDREEELREYEQLYLSPELRLRAPPELAQYIDQCRAEIAVDIRERDELRRQINALNL